MRKSSQQTPFLVDLQADQDDLARIRHHRHVVSRLTHSFTHKEHEIEQLKALLAKYQHYQQKYTSLKVELNEKALALNRAHAENKLLRTQLQESISEQTQLAQKVRQAESDRQSQARERQFMEQSAREVEATFKEYQAECKRRETAMQKDIEHAYQQLKEANARNDLLEIQLQTAQHSLQSQHQTQILQKKTELAEEEQRRMEDLEKEVEQLKRQALGKEQELAEAMAFNYELTVEYDKAINAICNLETELSRYRQDNQDLRRANSQLREDGKHRDIQAKYGKTRPSPHSHYLTPDSPSSSQSRSHSHSRQQQQITIHS